MRGFIKKLFRSDDLRFDDINTQRFVQYVQLYCKTNNIAITLSPTEVIDNVGGACNGYFDHDVPELKVAIKKPKEKWLQIFVHEFAHATQWVEDCDEWHICSLDNGDDAYTLLGDWVAGDIELTKEQAAHYAYLSRLFEQDCDKRAYNLILAWKLPINLEEYVQRSNAYHLFYEYMGKTRRWYPEDGAPYNIEPIWKKMPKDWVDHPAPYLIDLISNHYDSLYNKQPEQQDAEYI